MLRGGGERSFQPELAIQKYIGGHLLRDLGWDIKLVPKTGIECLLCRIPECAKSVILFKHPPYQAEQ